MQTHDGDQNAFRGLGLRLVTSQDEPFLRKLFASTRADELALMNLDENQRELFIEMQFRAGSQCDSYLMLSRASCCWTVLPLN